jgi:hypothetical protein
LGHIPAEVPDDQEQRLALLRDPEVLDTPAEETLDRLTRLATAICETPIALISLIDAERQWFKARVGARRAGDLRGPKTWAKGRAPNDGHSHGRPNG